MKIEDIKHLKITPGIHQWDGKDDDGMTAGSIHIILPNDTQVRICVVQYETGRYRNEISIHNLKDTELTIYSKVKKAIRKVKNTIWTNIEEVEA